LAFSYDIALRYENISDEAIYSRIHLVLIDALNSAGSINGFSNILNGWLELFLFVFTGNENQEDGYKIE
jgi:hypothetical protein